MVLPFWSWPPALLVALLAFLSFTGTRDPDRVMHASWILCVVIGWIVPSFSETRSVAVRRISATVAKYSYSIYLTHMLALWVVFSKLQYTETLLSIIAGVTLLVVLPIVTYHLIEAPGIRMGARIGKRLATSSP
jgi:peptidoglycan/LPS O-acetylase OafA/YrhL